jgi:hypothetical protein
MNVDHLSRYLGCPSQQAESATDTGPNLLMAINQSLLNIQARDHGLAVLQTSVDGLLAAMNDESHRSSSEFFTFSISIFSDQALALDIETIASLIDRQRQDQEGLFRALTSGTHHFLDISNMLDNIIEISDEIKGERLRFVEAMKEATAINVQSKLCVIDFVYGC